MIHYSVLIPTWDSTAALPRLLRQLSAVLERLVLPYEILCIDDARRVAGWNRLMHRYRHLRVLRFSEQRGTSASLAAGIAASRGDLILTIAARRAALARRLPQLIARLADYDFVVALQHGDTPSEHIRAQFAHMLCAIWGDELADSETILWAARRPAVANLPLARGAWRFLPALVERRGCRVGTVEYTTGLAPRGRSVQCTRLGKLAAGWHGRRFEPYLAQELLRDTPLPIRPEWLRLSAARARYRAHANLDVADRASEREHYEDILFSR